MFLVVPKTLLGGVETATRVETKAEEGNEEELDDRRDPGGRKDLAGCRVLEDSQAQVEDEDNVDGNRVEL